ncbi:MAG TPA: thiamine pyrophosphate-binding protein [Candidatus Binatia bacterium]|jgi:acetolactate synthase-1/2/3 large subunit|nr:thiamine pyrophosphate-binding protein [Candidatus Binatia bacterium]
MNKPIEAKGGTITGAEAVVEMLKAHGVEIIFGLCGDTSLPFYDALARLKHGMRHILTRDERSAAYMADGYARVSGKVGVCEGPSGGGATYILPGLAEANESSVPVLCINSDISVSARGRYTLTELDQGALMRPVTKWNAVLDRSQDIPRVFRAAFNEMTTGRPGATHIALPFDVQNGPVDRNDVWGEGSLGQYPAHRVAPDPFFVELAAKLLRTASRPVFVCGGGVVIAGAEQELLQLAERLSAPVATSVSGKGSISEEHPLAIGVVGSNGGTPETRAVVDEVDLVVFVGCRAGSVTTERWRHPAPDKVNVIHLDVDPAVLGANYRVDVPLVGDAKLTLAALNEALATVQRPLDASAVKKAKEQKFAKFHALARSEDKPIRPERVVAELTQALDPDAIVVADPGTPCPYFSAYYPVRGTGRRFFSNRAHGALGYSMSAAIGAHFARPDVKSVSVMGDGSFGFTCGELETVVRHRLPITFIVISNGTYGWIKAGQKSGYGARYFAVDFDTTDHAAVAAAYGVKSWRVTEPSDLGKALKEALAHAGPSLVDVVCQPLHEAKAPVSDWIA